MMGEVIVVQSVSTGWHGPLSDFNTALGGQTFEAWNTPNSPTFDDVARLCPPPNALNGIPGCNLIADSADQSIACRSKHPGGVNTSLCDGSVRFFTDGINIVTWRALATAQGGETVTND